MSSRGPRRPRVATCWIVGAIALAGCAAEQDGPAAPGGTNGIMMTYVSPRLQVVPADAPAEVELALEVRRADASGVNQPYPGARLRVVREKGRGALASSLVTADASGVARVGVTMPATTDKTAVVVSLERDSDSFLPFDVVSAPVVPLELAAGEVRHLDPPRDGALLRVAFDPGARYVLIPHHTDVERGGVPYRFFHQLPDQNGFGAAAFGADAIAEPYRAATAASPDPGTDIVAGEVDPGRLTTAAAVPDSVHVESCRIPTNRHAPLRYHGRSIAIYVDDERGMHQARIDSLGLAFDERIEPTNTRTFGRMTDLDGNGVVLAIFSPDLEGGLGGAYCESVRKARVEAFYARWDPEQRIEGALAIMAHEHQHVINAGHHLAGGLDETLWLNEALSLGAEFVNESWYSVLPRAWRFLNGQNGGLTMLPLEYQRAFDDAYTMFVIYLWDRFGPSVFLNLGTNGLIGRRNVEAVTGQPLEALLRDWFVALAVSGRSSVDDPRYAYSTLDLAGMEEEISGCRCVPVAQLAGMRLEPLHLGLGFDAFRTLAPADADYYELIAPSEEATSWDIYYDAYGRQAMRLSVARLR